jgi:6-phosphogluconolactonase/glucosamine-6-phosphate isomerase/deaminase
MNIITSPTPAMIAGTELGRLLETYEQQPILLLLSGGSALSILDYVDTKNVGPNLTITTLDERFSIDPTVNNFAQIQATDFFFRAQAQGAMSIATTILADDSLVTTGARFTNELHTWRNTHPKGIIIATMGVGPDGHTAGIFPHQPEFDFTTSNWVQAYTLTPDTNPYTKRITVTPTFLTSQVTHAIGYITGEKKRPLLEQLRNSQCSPQDTPACIMQAMPAVTIVTDIVV